MAKIDITQIEGYDTMTAEEKLAALEAFEYEDNSEELERYKKAVSKANTDAAEWKKKHNALLTADDQAKQAREEELIALKNENESLKREKAVSTYKAKFLALGYEETLANDTAEALAEGNMEKVFENQKKHITAHDKKIEADLLKGTSRPDKTGTNNKQMSTDDIMKITDPVERQEAIAANIELFNGV